MAGILNTVTIPRTYKSGRNKVTASYITDDEANLLRAVESMNNGGTKTENQYGPGGLLVFAPPRGGPHQDDGAAWSFTDGGATTNLPVGTTIQKDDKNNWVYVPPVTDYSDMGQDDTLGEEDVTTRPGGAPLGGPHQDNGVPWDWPPTIDTTPDDDTTTTDDDPDDDKDDKDDPTDDDPTDDDPTDDDPTDDDPTDDDPTDDDPTGTDTKDLRFFDIFSPYRNEQRYTGPTVLQVDAPSRGLLDYSRWMPSQGSRWSGLLESPQQRAMFANQGANWQPQWQSGGYGYQPPQGVTYAPDYQTVDTTTGTTDTTTDTTTDATSGTFFGQPYANQGEYHRLLDTHNKAMQLIRGGHNRGFGIGQLMGMSGQVNQWYMNLNNQFGSYTGGSDVSVGNRDVSLLNTGAQSPSWQGGGRWGMDEYGLLQPQEVQVGMGSGYTYPDVVNPYPGLVDPTFDYSVRNPNIY